MTDSKTDDWMDTHKAAQYANVSEYTLRDWVNRGIIPATRPGGNMLRFKREDIDAAIRARAVKPKESGEGGAE